MSQVDVDSLAVGELYAELSARSTALQPGQTAPAERPRAIYAEPRPEFAHLSAEELTHALFKKQKATYNSPDQREEALTAAARDPSIAKNVECVAALVPKDSLALEGSGYRLRAESFGGRYNLAATEPFREQLVPAFGTAFLVAPDLLVTAAHCFFVKPGVLRRSLDSIRVVFGFGLLPDGTVPPIPTSNVFEIEKVAEVAFQPAASLHDGSKNYDLPDWAILRLKNPASGRHHATLRQAGKIEDNAPLYVIGHPCGLPAKFAGGAQVKDNSPTHFFRANLDTFGGNSGSPVFHTGTHQVEGILVRGDTDFISINGRQVSMVIPLLPDGQLDSLGEHCNRLNGVTAALGRLTPR